MTKVVRAVDAKKAARELWGKKMKEQHRLIVSLMQKVNNLERRIGHLENVHVVELNGQKRHEERMITGSKEWKEVPDSGDHS